MHSTGQAQILAKNTVFIHALFMSNNITHNTINPFLSIIFSIIPIVTCLLMPQAASSYPSRSRDLGKRESSAAGRIELT
jgi:hypothetical protein